MFSRRHYNIVSYAIVIKLCADSRLKNTLPHGIPPLKYITSIAEIFFILFFLIVPKTSQWRIIIVRERRELTASIKRTHNTASDLFGRFTSINTVLLLLQLTHNNIVFLSRRFFTIKLYVSPCTYFKIERLVTTVIIAEMNLLAFWLIINE